VEIVMVHRDHDTLFLGANAQRIVNAMRMLAEQTAPVPAATFS